MSVKQVIVMRKDLNMRKGKIAAQAAHASMKVFFDRMVTLEEYRYIRPYTLRNAKVLPEPTPEMIEWIDGSFKKVCVSVNSELELDELYNKANEMGIPCSMIVDNGDTEFHGVKTKTCIAIGPDNSDKIDLLTKTLPLL